MLFINKSQRNDNKISLTANYGRFVCSVVPKTRLEDPKSFLREDFRLLCFCQEFSVHVPRPWEE